GHPLHLDVRVRRLEMPGQLLHLDHVPVVHRGDHEVGRGTGSGGEGQRSGDEEGGLRCHGCLLKRVNQLPEHTKKLTWHPGPNDRHLSRSERYGLANSCTLFRTMARELPELCDGSSE